MSAAARSSFAKPQLLADAVEDGTARLRTFMQAQMPEAEDLEILNVERTSVGQSRENWVFRAAWSRHGTQEALPLILRRDPTGSLLNTERRLEFAVLKALEHSNVPIPTAYFLDADGASFGRPSLIMRQVDGVCEWDVLNGNRRLEDRIALGRKFIALLTDIHQFDWQASDLAVLLAAPGPDAGLFELNRWEVELRRVQLEPHPELDLVLLWLRRHHRPATATALVHGDFKPGNALLHNDDIVAMLDWETAHLGDPIEDFGWILNPSRAREHQIASRWEQREIIAEYERLTTRTVDLDALRWWTIFSNWKLAVILLTGVHTFVNGRLDRIFVNPTWVIKTLLEMIRDD